MPQYFKFLCFKFVENATALYMYICPTRCNVTQFIFYLETALHVSGGTTTHHQERKQLYLYHLVFVTPLLLPAAMEPV